MQVTGLKKVFLMGCKKLRAILWWEGTRQLEVLCIDTLETEDTRLRYSVSDPSHIQHRNYVVIGDARFIQSLLIKEYGAIITGNLYIEMLVPPTTSSRSSKGSSRDKVIPKPFCYTYVDVLQQGIYTYDSEMKWPPPLDRHLEIAEGVNIANVESEKGIKAIYYVTLKCIHSLHVHDNSCILAVTPKRPGDSSWFIFVLRWCRVERCPKLETVFASGYSYEFSNLETIWASDLPVAACIWSKGSINDDSASFQALESIHLHKCPRLKFALPLSRYTYLPKLEILHITQCGNLRQVFPWDDDVNVPQQYREADPMKEFPNLKHILLHDLFNLEKICEAKMTTPMLESVRIRSCWGLRRLPMISTQNNSHRRPVVHCEEDWWTKLEWDGLPAGHHPSLYEPCYSSAYYKKRFLRGAVLR